MNAVFFAPFLFFAFVATVVADKATGGAVSDGIRKLDRERVRRQFEDDKAE